MILVSSNNMPRGINFTISYYIITATVIRTLAVTVSSYRNLKVYLLTPQYELQILASESVSVSNPALPATSSNNLLAYRPSYMYTDAHAGDRFGIIFLNLNGIFPCVPLGMRIPCGVVALEEDGFSGGHAIL
jgi:hypothetical protein